MMQKSPSGKLRCAPAPLAEYPRAAGSIAPTDPENELNIAGVYQDSVTQDWAMQTCRMAMQVVGEDRIRKTLYNAHSLSDSEILLDAARAAAEADVILVVVNGADELPLEVYVWIDIWLPRRRLRAGALTALMGVSETLDAQAVEAPAHEYLHAVARKGQLDFIPKVFPRSRRLSDKSPERSRAPLSRGQPRLSDPTFSELRGELMD